MKIAVTGGAGFIGTNLVQELLSNGHDVSILDDLSTGLKSNVEKLDLEMITGSINDVDVLDKFVANVDKVVHLAARGSVPRSIKNPLKTHEVNVMGTLNVLEACRKYNKYLIFSSSSSVYGSNTTLPKNEKQWTNPLSPYGASKLSGEAFVNSYGATYSLPVLVFRFFNVFGPWQRPDHDYAAVLPKWIWSAMNNEPIEVHGDGKQTRDFTFVQTPVQIIIDAIKREVTSQTPINLAYGNRISLLEVIEILRESFPNLEIVNSPERLGDVKNSQNDPSLLNEYFPSDYSADFKNALSTTIDWYRDNFSRIVSDIGIRG